MWDILSNCAIFNVFTRDRRVVVEGPTWDFVYLFSLQKVSSILFLLLYSIPRGPNLSQSGALRRLRAVRVENWSAGEVEALYERFSGRGTVGHL